MHLAFRYSTALTSAGHDSVSLAKTFCGECGVQMVVARARAVPSLRRATVLEIFLFHNFFKLQKWPNLGFLALFEIFDFFEKFVNFQKSKTLGLFPLMGRREINVVSFESYSCQLI